MVCGDLWFAETGEVRGAALLCFGSQVSPSSSPLDCDGGLPRLVKERSGECIIRHPAILQNPANIKRARLMPFLANPPTPVPHLQTPSWNETKTSFTETVDTSFLHSMAGIKGSKRSIRHFLILWLEKVFKTLKERV